MLFFQSVIYISIYIYIRVRGYGQSFEEDFTRHFTADSSNKYVSDRKTMVKLDNVNWTWFLFMARRGIKELGIVFLLERVYDGP